VLLTDSEILAEPRKLDFHLDNSRISWGLDKNNLPVDEEIENYALDFFYDGRFGVFGPVKFMVWNEKKLYRTEKPIQVDYVISAGRRKADLSLLNDIVEFDYLIIDSSVPYWKLKQLSEQAEDLNIRYFDVKAQRAFIAEIRE
jgi:hypothetical protein